jgi:hypothetical protein
VVRLSGQTEIRYTDHLPFVGDTVAIDGRRARVLSSDRDVVSPHAELRFHCRVTSELVPTNEPD